MTYEQYLEEKNREASGIVKNVAAGSQPNVREQTKQAQSAPTLDDVFDKKTYYNPGKILSRLKKQLEKYETMLSESEKKADEYKMQLMNPELASDYPKLMDIQSKLDVEEKKQESILERMLETELELEEMQEDKD